MFVSRVTLLKLAILSEGGAFLVALALGFFLHIDLFPVTRDFGNDLIIGTLSAIPPVILFHLSLSSRAEKIPVIGSLKKTMISDIKNLFSESHLIDLIIISICAGIAEELLFRGIFQVKFGIIAASVIFGLVHFVTPAYVLAATVMGLYIGILFRLFDSLLVPIQMHLSMISPPSFT